MVIPRNVLGFLLMLPASLLCGESGFPNAESFSFEADLGAEAHLLIADQQLEDQVRAEGTGESTERSESLREAQRLVREALQLYAGFRGQADPVATRRPAPPDAPESPLAPLEHLHLGREAAIQLAANIRIAAVAYTEADSARHDALDASIDRMKKAIAALESAGVWTVHFSSDAGVMLSTPPGFAREAPLKSEIVRLVRTAAGGATEKLVFMRKPTLAREMLARGPDTYREGRIEELRKTFPDLTVVARGTSESAPDCFTTSFVYRYAWRGDPIRAEVHVHRSGDRVFEVHYVALDDRFDREEAAAVFRSFRDLQAPPVERVSFRMAGSAGGTLVERVVDPERQTVPIVGDSELLPGMPGTYRVTWVTPGKVASFRWRLSENAVVVYQNETGITIQPSERSGVIQLAYACNELDRPRVLQGSRTITIGSPADLQGGFRVSAITENPVSIAGEEVRIRADVHGTIRTPISWAWEVVRLPGDPDPVGPARAGTGTTHQDELAFDLPPLFLTARPEPYEIRVTAKDARGLTDQKSLRLRVLPEPLAVQLEGPRQVAWVDSPARDLASYEAVATGGFEPYVFAWRCLPVWSEPRIARPFEPYHALGFSFREPGDYRIEVAVTDKAGTEARSVIAVSVEGGEPLSTRMLDLPQTAKPGETVKVGVQIRGGVMITAGRKDGYRLHVDWGDRDEKEERFDHIGTDPDAETTPAKGAVARVSHVFASPRDYTVRIQAIDAAGNVASETRQIRITDGAVAAPPPADSPLFTRPVLKLVRIEGPTAKTTRTGMSIDYVEPNSGFSLHRNKEWIGNYRVAERAQEWTPRLFKREVASLAVREFPLEITMGEAFEVMAELHMRTSYSPGHECTDPSGPDARRTLPSYYMETGAGPIFLRSQEISSADLERRCQRRSICRTLRRGVQMDGWIVGEPCRTGMTEPEARVRLLTRYLPAGISSAKPPGVDAGGGRRPLGSIPEAPLAKGESRTYHYRVEHEGGGATITEKGELFADTLDIRGVYSSWDEVVIRVAFVHQHPGSATPILAREEIKLHYRIVDAPPLTVTPYPHPDALTRPPVDEPWMEGSDEETGETGTPPDDRERPGPGPIDPTRPEVAALIREWIAVARPPENAIEGNDVRYSGRGNIIGRVGGGILESPHETGAVDPVYLWTNKRTLDSVDHCTLEEYVNARLKGESTSRCAGRYGGLRAVPDVTGQPLADAAALLRQHGFKVAPALLGPAPGRELGGRIAAQRPVAAARLRPGATVEVDVHGDYVEPRAVVPDLAGLPLGDARRELERAGLRVEPVLLGAARSAEQAQRVHTQSPAAGASVEPGSAVKVDVWGDYVPPVQAKGGTICFTRWPPGGSAPALYVINPDGTNERMIARAAAEPRLSHDGRWVAYRTGGSTKLPLEICGVDGTGRRRPVSASGFFGRPAWTADGRSLYFAYALPNAADDPDWVLGSAKLDIAGIWHLPFSGHSYLPAPDGARAAFLRSAGGGDCIFITQVGMAGDGGRQITQSPRYPQADGGVSWSPDSSTLAFIRSDSGAMSVCTVPSQGGPVRVLTTGIKCWPATAWSPRMTHILIIQRIPAANGRDTGQLAFVNLADGSIEPFAAAGVGIVAIDWR